MRLLDLLALHMLGDYILQNDWMAQNKLENWRVRLVHVICYSLPFGVWALWLYGLPGVWFGLGVFITHFVIDSHRFYANHPWPPKSILVDQALHIITLAMLVHLLLGIG